MQVRLMFVIYADPGSGMLIWQLITAAFLGFLFYFKHILRKARAILGRKPKLGDGPANREN